MAKRLHYYDAHESAYVEKTRAGQLSWDNVEYDSFLMRPFLEHALADSKFRGRHSATALDLGCGTGPASCYLSAAGLQVTGVDVSPTAIRLAREIAAERKLPIRFVVADLLNDPFPGGQFDVIIDGHLLHCIVFEHERVSLLRKVHDALSVDGEFWIETMVLEEDWEWPVPRNHCLDSNGVLWARLDAGDPFIEAERRGDDWWLPQRLIARSHRHLLRELKAAGFDIVEFECCPPTQVEPPGCLRVRCVRRDSAP